MADLEQVYGCRYVGGDVDSNQDHAEQESTCEEFEALNFWMVYDGLIVFEETWMNELMNEWMNV